MEVVSLRRLESQKYSTATKKSVFYLVPQMVTAGVILAVIFIVTAIKIENLPQNFDNLPTQPAASLHTKGPVRPYAQTINPEQIAPDSNDMAIVFANKFLEALPPPTPDCKVVACVALTFDDGPEEKSTTMILDSLDRNFAHATFFVLGYKVAGSQDLIKRMHQSNNEIGNHSWNHASFLTIDRAGIQHQVSKTQDAIKKTGVPAPQLFRPPYGDFLVKMQRDIKLAVILWNVDPKDWDKNNPAKIAEVVKKQVKPGSIIVMHDKMATAKALPIILRDLRTKYKFVTVSQLLNLKPNAKGVYVGR